MVNEVLIGGEGLAGPRLTAQELDEVSGGLLPIALWLFVIGMGVSGGYSEVADGYTGW